MLGYERLRRMHGWDDTKIAQYVADLQGGALVVQPADESIPRTVPHDPNDDPIVATALAGQADVLCTLDHHLHHADVLAYCASHGIRVLTDSELLAEFRAEQAEPEPLDPHAKADE